MPSPDLTKLSPDELNEAWPALSDEDRVQGFELLTDEEAEDFLSHLRAGDAVDLLRALPEPEQRRLLRSTPPDDIADMVGETEEEERPAFLALLTNTAREEASELLEYEEDEAGHIMTPRYARLRADMTVNDAIEYLRRQKSDNAEIIYYAYVVDAEEHLLGVVSFRELVISSPQRRIRDLMTTDIVKIPDEMDQEEVSRIFAREDLYCLPVVDAAGCMKGIVTADDIVDVVEEEATEDMHKLGGTEALAEPYLQTTLFEMLRKRGVWLIILLLLGFLTVEAMSRYSARLQDLVVLSIFVPLIISCGGNTGSQASTLVVRAMALGEVRLRDWWRVIRREFLIGAALGLTLGITGLLAAIAWNAIWTAFHVPRMGESPVRAAIAIACSIWCVVLWGTLAGSTLPFLLRRLHADPASASAPLVATLVDSSGLVIYFTVASSILHALNG